MTDRDVMQQALVALEAAEELAGKHDAQLEYGFHQTITVLKTALEQQAEPVAELQQVGPVEDMMLRRAALRSAKIVFDGRFVAKQAEPVAWNAGVAPMWPQQKEGETFSVSYTTPPQQQAEPVAWMYQHEETGRTAFIEMSEHKDGWKPSSSRMKLIGPLYTTPPQQQAEMRMPKVGDKVICLEDESLGTVKSLTAGGSPDITFDDGSRGTYMLREFAELFGYVAPPQQQAEPTPWRDMVVVSLVREGVNKHRARELADHFAAQQQAEPVAYIHRQFNHYEVSERPLLDDEKARGWTEEPLYATPPQRPWVGLTDDEIETIYAECNVWDKFEYERMLEAKLKERNNG